MKFTALNKKNHFENLRKEEFCFADEGVKVFVKENTVGTNRLGINTTPTLLKSLANYTNSNVIGFHILPRNKRTALHEMGHELRHHQKESMWARLINDSMPRNVVNIVKKAADRAIELKVHKGEMFTIACYGLTYKANIDDLRESPALNIVERLVEETNCKFLVIEPNIQYLPESIKKYFPK